MQTCEVCGRDFRALNLNHLRTHGIVSWEQYQEQIAQRAKPDQTIIREVTHALLHRQDVPEEHARKLAEINAGQQAHLPEMMGVIKLRRVRRLQKLMEALERMEDVAFAKEDLADEMLLEMMKYASGDIEKIIKQLSEASKTGGFSAAVDQVVNNTGNTYNIVQSTGVPTAFDNRLPEDPRAQASLMTKVDALIKAAQGKIIVVQPMNSNAQQPVTGGEPPGQ